MLTDWNPSSKCFAARIIHWNNIMWTSLRKIQLNFSQFNIDLSLLRQNWIHDLYDCKCCEHNSDSTLILIKFGRIYFAFPFAVIYILLYLNIFVDKIWPRINLIDSERSNLPNPSKANLLQVWTNFFLS